MPRLSSVSSRSLTGIGMAIQLKPWDLTKASYANKSVNVNTQDGWPAGLSFKKDGTAMYIAGKNNSTVYQYNLSTAWDVSTATYASKSVSVGTQISQANSLDFSSDGTKMFVVGWGSTNMYQYTLSTAWDVSTATYASKSFNYSSAGGAASGMRFRTNGSAFYINGSNDTIHQFTLTTPWDISTASYANKSKSVAYGGDLNPTGIDFKYDGTIMFVVDTSAANNRRVTPWVMSTPWDITTATASASTTTVGAQDTNSYDFCMRYDGLAFYVVGPNVDTVFQYKISADVLPSYNYSVALAADPIIPSVTSYYGASGQSTTVSSTRLSLVSSAQARFGTQSLQGTTVQAFLGRANAVNITLPSTLLPPLTIEAWVYCSVGYASPDWQGSPPIYLHGPEVDVATTNPSNSIRLYGTPANVYGISYSDQIVQGGAIIGGGNDSGATPIPLNTWQHMALAIAADGTTKSVWVNGTRRSSAPISPALTASMTTLTLNAFGAGSGPQYIDEIRVSNIDRYGVSNATITVPTSQFTSDANTLALVHF